jgi:hypothetical protein
MIIAVIKMTERSDIHKYSIINIQSSIPACSGPGIFKYLMVKIITLAPLGLTD